MPEPALLPELASICPGGANTYSKSRHPANAPKYARFATGAWLDCSDGRSYIDCTSALGAVILGHGSDDVVNAVVCQLGRGVSFSLPTEMEYTLGKRMLDLVPGAEMIRFGKNGNDVTNAAIRIARAATGSDRIVMFANGYHGHADPFMTRPPKNGGVPLIAQAQTLFTPPHDAQALEDTCRRYRPACVIMEAVVSGDPALPDPAYFKAARQICDKYGVLLILDEMVTGFRMGFPGALSHYGIEPDLVCYGKAMANGFPLSALLGRRELMLRIEQDVFYSTTFAGEALSLAAGIATLDVLEKENVSEVLAERGRSLMSDYAALAKAHGQDTELYGYPQRPMMRWADADLKTRFLEACVDNGLLIQGYFNLTLAFDELVMRKVVNALDAAFVAVSERKRAA